MEKVESIIKDFEEKKFKFHKKEEYDIFSDTLYNYKCRKFTASAILGAVLYEQIFTTRLIRETANPSGFKPGKDNINNQMENLLKKEDEIINQKKFSFRRVTLELKKLGILSESEKNEYDRFYTEIRNPVLHGLTVRLFEKVENRKPANPFEHDISSGRIYKIVSEMIIIQIYSIMVTKKLLKT